MAEESGDTVQQGVVIEDVSASTDENVQGSQYVWIPVGTFIKDDGTTSEEIKLGRYTFDETNGTPNLEQDAANYLESVEIIGSCVEEPTYRVGIESTGINALNATAKDLAGFIDSVNVNKGYYIGRYEASYASGSSTADYKAASKISATYSEAGMEYNSGTLWNYIKQMDASKVGINTYADSTSVKSDLINSYAWDTALVYIHEAENINYAYKVNESSTIANTGANNDEVCKINDMALNLREWTTEYSNYTMASEARPCVSRGSPYGYVNFPSTRDESYSINYDTKIGFRVCLFIA